MFDIPSFSYRIAYCDTDAAGIVYHARYFDIAERSRNEVLHHFGYGLRDIERDFGLRFVVSNAKAAYQNAAFLGDVLTTKDLIVYCSAATIKWTTALKRGFVDISSITVRLAAIGKDSQITILPDQITEMFMTIQERLGISQVTARTNNAGQTPKWRF